MTPGRQSRQEGTPFLFLLRSMATSKLEAMRKEEAAPTLGGPGGAGVQHLCGPGGAGVQHLCLFVGKL